MHPYAGTDPEEAERVKTLHGRERDAAEAKARGVADNFFKVVMRNLVKVRDPVADRKRRENLKAEMQRIKKEEIDQTRTTTAVVATIDHQDAEEPVDPPPTEDSRQSVAGLYVF